MMQNGRNVAASSALACLTLACLLGTGALLPALTEVSGSSPDDAVDPTGAAPADVPAPSARAQTSAAEGSVVLGRPTDRSMTANVLADKGTEVRIDYGLSDGSYTMSTSTAASADGEPVVLVMDNLTADTEYFYRAAVRPSGQAGFANGPGHSFHTQRAPGSAFTFGVQGDSHPERLNKMFDPTLYARTMGNAANGTPDLYFTLGDDFSIERLIDNNQTTKQSVDAVYLYQRQFLDMVGSDTSLFLVNGNHEQAARYLLNGSPNSPAVLAGNARNEYYPLPAPDGFYTGDSEPVEHMGLPRDYYAFTWGDALFVTLDFYWHSPVPVDNVAGGGSKRDNMWNITLGDAQYEWFRQALAGSNARYKFVFTHHVMGTGRGGIECADGYEWGGEGDGGVWAFDSQRPGWDSPIHQTMAEFNVSIFFFGHDHIFARQEKDGVVYQSVPNPADPTYTAFNSDAYLTGDKLPDSGHLRITVAPEGATVDYVRSWLAQNETGGHANGEVAFSYTVQPRTFPPPAISTADVATAVQGAPYNVTYRADAAVAWSLATNASWLAMDGATGVLSGTPANADVGRFWVNVSARDGMGGGDFSNFTLTVMNINDPPEITTPDATTAVEDLPYSVQYSASDIDPTKDVVSWGMWTDAGWLNMTPAGLLKGTPGNADAGAFRVNVTASDGAGGSDFSNFTLTVLNVNDPPEITTSPPANATAGVEYRAAFAAADPDQNDSLAWSLATDADWLGIDSASGVLSGTPGSDDVGTVSVSVRASDTLGANDTLAFSISVAGAPEGGGNGTGNGTAGGGGSQTGGDGGQTGGGNQTGGDSHTGGGNQTDGGNHTDDGSGTGDEDPADGNGSHTPDKNETADPGTDENAGGRGPSGGMLAAIVAIPAVIMVLAVAFLVLRKRGGMPGGKTPEPAAGGATARGASPGAPAGPAPSTGRPAQTGGRAIDAAGITMPVPEAAANAHRLTSPATSSSKLGQPHPESNLSEDL